MMDVSSSFEATSMGSRKGGTHVPKHTLALILGDFHALRSRSQITQPAEGGLMYLYLDAYSMAQISADRRGEG